MTQVRFLLRLPGWLHRRLAARAAVHELSLNEYCVRQLAAAEPVAITEPASLAVRAHADTIAGAKLAGIIVLGSWARGETRTSSDVDVIIAADPTFEITRAVYREWDRHSLTWQGRPVDAHLVHVPANGILGGSLWCEAAIDGVLLYDRDGRIDATLRRIRRAVADGHLIRRHAHGQPYWMVAA